MGVQAFAKDLGRAVPIRLRNQQNRVGQSEAHRDSTSVAPGGGTQREAHSGEDPHRHELFGPGNKARDEGEIRDVDEARVLLLCMRLSIRVQMANLVRTGRGSGRVAEIQTFSVLGVAHHFAGRSRIIRCESWRSMTKNEDVE